MIVTPFNDVNSWNIQLLTEHIKASSVLPFVGAGLSASFNLPTWTKFLTEQAQKWAIDAEVQTLLAEEMKDYEGAADLIFSRSAGLFIDSIKSTFATTEDLTAKVGTYSPPFEINELNASAIPPVMLLPYLIDGPVFTTNFDEVLAIVYAAAGIPFSLTVDGSSTDSLAEAISRGQHILVKLHGSAANDRSRVLMGAEYKRHYLDDQGSIDFKKNLPKCLKYGFGKKTFLFLGCSLAKDRTLDVLRQNLQYFPDDRHFAIVQRPTNDRDWISFRSHLESYNICPIWYPQHEHHWISRILFDVYTNIDKKPKRNNSHLKYEKIKINVIGENNNDKPRTNISLSHSGALDLLSYLNHLISAQKISKNFESLCPGFARAGLPRELLLTKTNGRYELSATPWLTDKNTGSTLHKIIITEKVLNRDFLYQATGYSDEKIHTIRIDTISNDSVMMNIMAPNFEILQLQISPLSV